jgi:hypothetical protein
VLAVCWLHASKTYLLLATSITRVMIPLNKKRDSGGGHSNWPRKTIFMLFVVNITPLGDLVSSVRQEGLVLGHGLSIGWDLSGVPVATVLID